MKNRYMKRARISERKFREVLKLYAVDLPALTVSELSGLNYRTVHRMYMLLRERVVSLALKGTEAVRWRYRGGRELFRSSKSSRRERERSQWETRLRVTYTL